MVEEQARQDRKLVLRARQPSCQQGQSGVAEGERGRAHLFVKPYQASETEHLAGWSAVVPPTPNLILRLPDRRHYYLWGET